MKYSIDEMTNALNIIKETCHEYYKPDVGKNCPFCLGMDCDSCAITEYGISPYEWEIAKNLKVTLFSRNY